MPIVNRVADLAAEITAWRHDIHAHPELQYDVHRTAALVAEKLKAFGCDEVVTGIGRTGVVGVIKGRKSASGASIGLRADMDALPIEEANDLPYKSTVPGKMHACGHDGHTAMLLGAARYLTETRNFAGEAVLIFQPAEEGGAGARAMIEDGLLTRFRIDEVYGMHNYPGLPVGEFGIKSGPVMAATDSFTIRVEGRGGHAARPHLAVDAVLTAAQVITNLQAIVARNVDPLKSGVISVCMVHAGNAFNVLPQVVTLAGTIRSFEPQVRELLIARLRQVAEGTAAAQGASAAVSIAPGYPVLVNHAQEAAYAADIAKDVAGADRVDTNLPAMMGAEDFAFMLLERPGAFIWVGNGDSAGLHHPAYNFNDDVIPLGTSYWVKLVETRLAA